MPPGRLVIVALVIATAAGFGSAGRIIGSYSNITLRRHHLGHVDAVLGVGVAIVAVLLSVWLVAAVISSPNSRFTWLDAAVARSDILHSVDNVLPQAPSVFGQLQTFLSDQGFPQVFSTLTPPSTPSVVTPSDTETRALADPAVFSTVKILGIACNSEQEGSGFVVGHGLVATNAHVVAGEPGGSTQVMIGDTAYGATAVLFDPSFDLAVLRTDAPLARRCPSAQRSSGVGPRPRCLGTPRTARSPSDPPGVTSEITAVGRDIYNDGSVTRGVYSLQANVEPGNSGGPLMGPGGEVIGVVFSRSTGYPDVGYALTSPGVLAGVQEAALHRGAGARGRAPPGRPSPRGGPAIMRR